ncbi:DNA repair protein RAD51 homolog 2-like [Haliotis rufescens]|uniref:DNA repair protein RAD51 homolog 2-like n=1 Tax=Haliotis rufescens TaxID=6454 RepID=UPI00201F7ED5|nr:DNA repair protein RAD51 homolog 2-like [Haliotis rufescens]
MSSKRLKRLNVPREALERLTQHNIGSCRGVLSRSTLELLKLTGCGYLTVTDIIDQCCHSCIPPAVTALQLWRGRSESRSAFLPTTLPDLDMVLHGGLPVGTITEIAGPSGCGKTQFSIMLSVLSAMSEGSHSAVIYIDTEGAFSAERLVEVARSKFPTHFQNERDIVDLANRVYVDSIQSCSSLMKRLKSLEEDIITKKVKLIVVDSIASLVRKEFSTSIGQNLTDRTNFLSQEAAILKYVAEVFSIPIVVTNQITTRYGRPDAVGDCDNDGSSSVTAEGDGGYVTAALGNTWSHSVNTRLILQYLDADRRQVLVAKSPVAPFTSFTYTVQKQGIVQEDDGAGHYHGTDPSMQHIRVRSSLPIQASQV